MGTEIKSEVKVVEHDPIYLEMVKKAEMLEEIKMKEQNLIEKLAMMKKKMGRNVEVKEDSNDTSVTKINLTQEPSKEAVSAPVLMTREQKLARIRELKEQQKQILEKHKLEEKRIRQEEEERIQKEKEERLQKDEEDRIKKEDEARIKKEEEA